MIVAIFDLERQAKSVRPFVAGQDANCVNSFSTYFGNQAAAAGSNKFGVQTVFGAAHHLGKINHRLDDAPASVPSSGAETLGRRNQTRIHQRHGLHWDSEHRHAATIDADRDLLPRDV